MRIGSVITAGRSALAALPCLALLGLCAVASAAT
jgi:hypothetical protein